MSARLSSIIVAIPANNEADRIGRCLEALGRQQAAPDFQTVLLANNCTDETEAIGRFWQRNRMPGLHVVGVTLPGPLAHAGEARRLALAEALRLSRPDGVLLTTDADTVAPPGWVASNMAALTPLQGPPVDAVAGRAVIDTVEARSIPQHLHEIDALECAYAALLDEIAALLAPDAHDPWPRHDEHSGASIAVRVPAYLAAGGVPSLPTGEDRALFRALRQTGARIRHAPEVWVTVSGRLEGRAKGGMAETIRYRLSHAPEWLDDRLPPLAEWVARTTRGMAPSGRRVAVADVEREIARATRLRDRLRAGVSESGVQAFSKSSRYLSVRDWWRSRSLAVAMKRSAAASPPVG